MTKAAHADIPALLTDRDELVRRLAKVEALRRSWQSSAYVSRKRSSAIVRGSSEVWKAAAQELAYALEPADRRAAPVADGGAG